MKDKTKPLKFQLSYGTFGTRIGMNHLEATEFILLKEYNDDILVRVKDLKMRNIGINISEKEFYIIQKEIFKKSKPGDSHVIQSFYLWTEGMNIAIFCGVKKEIKKE